MADKRRRSDAVPEQERRRKSGRTSDRGGSGSGRKSYSEMEEEQLRKRKKKADGKKTENHSSVAKKSSAQKSSNKKSSGKKKKKRKGMSLGKKIGLTFCIILLLAILAVIAVLASKMNKLEVEVLDPDKLSISDELDYDEEGYLNVALFGLDTRENDVEMGTRSDTIIIASLNRKTKEIKISSIFRDTLMRQEDGSYNKANAAYSFGEEEEAIAMLNRNLDMDIQRYVTVDFSAMVDVVDALGGVEIDVLPEEIDYINGYGTSITENTGVETPMVLYSGPQVLNGVQATAYARIRQVGNNDFQRAERQRTVLLKIAEKAQNASIATLNKIIDRVFPKVKTNFSMAEILAYSKDVKKYQLGESVGFPFDLTTQLLDVGDSVIPATLESNVIDLHKYFFGEDGYSPSSTVKEISEEIAYLTGVAGSYNYDTSSDYGTDSDTDYDYSDSYGADYNTDYDDGTSWDTGEMWDDSSYGDNVYTDETW